MNIKQMRQYAFRQKFGNEARHCNFYFFFWNLFLLLGWYDKVNADTYRKWPIITTSDEH